MAALRACASRAGLLDGYVSGWSRMTLSGSWTDGQGVRAGLKPYFFTGRVYPERYGWGVSGLSDRVLVRPDGSRAIFRFHLSHSQLVVMVLTDSEHVEILDLKNDVNRLTRVALDALGFVHAVGLDLEIVSYVDPSGASHVFNTGFDGLRDGEDPERDGHELEMFNLLIDQAHLSPNVRSALADIRNAIREPTDTSVNCYRAVESIRREYLGGQQDTGAAGKRSWVQLREIAGVEASEMFWLKGLADPRRHGGSVDLSHTDRERALRLARRVVERHCRWLHAGGDQGAPVVA
jgi:hypothetical protein